MKKTQNLVLITPDNTIKTDIIYATSDNFTGAQVYDQPILLLHKEAVEQLFYAASLLKPIGLKFKIWDGYRPIEAQRRLFQHTPNPLYVSDPDNGPCCHCRGIALDLTLIDKNNNELPMGTGFDDFRQLAHHGNQSIAANEQKNRMLLAGIMALAGFKHHPSEWWHYQLPNSTDYPIINEAEAKTGIIHFSSLAQ